ncbi:aquaporin [Methylocapsa polymorpha]|uniref:Aquaporin n=1 Tax=Methylocapsa polymorpha TaxID=3080828 RepID=A0ABZ0HPH5_9HYPH|nr:aquaporin [Methylocapsa sp. RX1]
MEPVVPTEKTKKAAHSFHSKVAAEFIGTALLVFGGLSLIFAVTWPHGLIAGSLGHLPLAQRALAGFAFGAFVGILAISPLGRMSGAHFNPSITLALWRRGGVNTPIAVCYMFAQLCGGVLGAAALSLWGDIADELHYGLTAPGPDVNVWTAFIGEVVVTFLLVSVVLGQQRWNLPTIASFLAVPILFSLMTMIEAPLSGTSTNLARSIGPALAARDVSAVWIYAIGPAIGAVLASYVIPGRTYELADPLISTGDGVSEWHPSGRPGCRR